MKYLLPSSNTAKTTLSLTKETDICKLDHLGAGMFQVVFEKAEEPEIKWPTSAGSWKKQESYRKASIAALLTMWMWFGALPGAFGLGRAQPQRRGTSP